MKNNAKKIIKDLSVKSFAGKFLRRCVHALKYGHSRLFKEEPNIKMFDTGEFYLKDSGKREAYLEERIYMDDEGAAVCYAFGIDYIKHADDIQGKGFKETVNRIMGLKKRLPNMNFSSYIKKEGGSDGLFSASYDAMERAGLDSSNSRNAFDKHAYSILRKKNPAAPDSRTMMNSFLLGGWLMLNKGCVI
jgi:hypothetical protein